MATAKTPVSEAKIIDVAEAMFRAYNDHDVDSILEHLTDDVVWAEPSIEEPLRGKDAVAADLKETFTAFPDMHFRPEDFHVFPSEEKSASIVAWTMTASMTGGPAAGLPATGKSVKISGTTYSRFRGELICEYTTVYDSLDMLQQLGMLPKTSGLPFKALVMADVMAGKAVQAIRR